MEIKINSNNDDTPGGTLAMAQDAFRFLIRDRGMRITSKSSSEKGYNMPWWKLRYKGADGEIVALQNEYGYTNYGFRGEWEYLLSGRKFERLFPMTIPWEIQADNCVYLWQAGWMFWAASTLEREVNRKLMTYNPFPLDFKIYFELVATRKSEKPKLGKPIFSYDNDSDTFIITCPIKWRLLKNWDKDYPMCAETELYSALTAMVTEVLQAGLAKQRKELVAKAADDVKWIWVFQGEHSDSCNALYDNRLAAEKWISENSLSGILTKVPLNCNVYDWAVNSGVFVPKKDYQREASFIQRFTSAYLEHYHYRNGKLLNH